jgi:hypothetical protein
LRYPIGLQRGMAIAEIAVAAAALAVGLVAVSAAFPSLGYAIQEGKQLSTATFLATQRLEQVRGARWELGPPAVDELGVSPTSQAAPMSGVVTTFPDEPALPGAYAGYSRSVRIADCSAGCSGVARADLRQITVSVSYRSMTAGGGLAAAGSSAATVTMYVGQR